MLIRAARDFAVEQPGFALAAGMTGLRGVPNGYGFDITDVDILDAYAPRWRQPPRRRS